MASNQGIDMRWRKRHEGFDLEAELRTSRPEPSAEFVQRLESRVGNEGRTRAGCCGSPSSVL